MAVIMVSVQAAISSRFGFLPGGEEGRQEGPKRTLEREGIRSARQTESLEGVPLT